MTQEESGGISASENLSHIPISAGSQIENLIPEESMTKLANIAKGAGVTLSSQATEALKSFGLSEQVTAASLPAIATIQESVGESLSAGLKDLPASLPIGPLIREAYVPQTYGSSSKLEPDITWKPIWHQLIVIGNGFDLTAGLPSSYWDFFNDREMAFGTSPSDDGAYGDLRYRKTVWDVILPEEGNPGWYDIESALTSWIKGPQTGQEQTRGNLSRVLNRLNGDQSQVTDAELRFANAIRQHSGDKSDRWSKRHLMDFLKDQLTLLEEDFNSYLSNAVLRDAGYGKRAKDLMCGILQEERPNGDDFDLHESILSLNYTSLSITLKTNSLDPYVNVHGKLGKEIVFGIDGTGCMDDPEILQFTKTYRLMGLDASYRQTIVRPNYGTSDDGHTALIKFYGHSLGEADYSYFQALFDSVRLYEGDTRLIFYYRPYGDKSPEEVRLEMMRHVTHLLTVYGETLDNQAHGKNLIHKMLAEGRLTVRELTHTEPDQGK